MDHLDGMHAIAIFLGTFIGGVTLTGSVVAFGKLSGMMSGKAMSLPGKNYINAGLALACVPAYMVYASTGDATLALEMLGGATAASLLLGYVLRVVAPSPAPSPSQVRYSASPDVETSRSWTLNGPSRVGLLTRDGPLFKVQDRQVSMSGRMPCKNVGSTTGILVVDKRRYLTLWGYKSIKALCPVDHPYLSVPFSSDRVAWGGSFVVCANQVPLGGVRGRRGHARDHHPAELVLRVGAVHGGLRAQQRDAHHRGRAHRLLRRHPLLHH
eukprot:9474786-Pyramimonas_sp.AAC.1